MASFFVRPLPKESRDARAVCLLYLSIMREGPVNVVAHVLFGSPITSFVIAVWERNRKHHCAA